MDMKQTGTSQSGKYLTFALGSEAYGIEILKVREIIGYMEITHVPQTPMEVKGVINLRGRVIPIINLRAKFNMPEAEITDQTCIIVVEVGTEVRPLTMGVIVDSVTEVLDIKEEQLEPPPELGYGVNRNMIRAMGKFPDGVKILLDISKVLKPSDLQSLAEVDIPFDL
jgi:purine-binding chemotaxis protein CheW